MTRIAVLDHGYVEVVESWGSDERIIEAARMSTAKGFTGWGPKGSYCPRTGCGWEVTDEEAKQAGDAVFTSRCPRCNETGLNAIQGDEKLLRYFWKHRHATPFEMAGLIVEVQAPIFVFREWHRHRTQSFNELSSRYTALPDLNYVPTVDRLLMQSKTNKQAAAAPGAEVLTAEAAAAYRTALETTYGHQQDFYELALAAGIPKELARVHLPVGRYSRMRAAANLRNWLAFLTLRLDAAAQWEIRQYAAALHSLLESLFPRTLYLFDGDR